MEKRVSVGLTAKDGRKFGFTLGIAFGVLGGIAWWRGKHTTATVFWVLSGLLLVSGLVVPTALGPVERAWMGLARAMSKVTTPIFMGVVYFVIITPVGAVMRLFGRNAMTQNRGRATAWVTRETVRGDLTRQF